MGMKIIKNRQEIRLSNGVLVYREEYTDGTFDWTFDWTLGSKNLYDKDNSKVLEAEYQKTFNK